MQSSSKNGRNNYPVLIVFSLTKKLRNMWQNWRSCSPLRKSGGSTQEQQWCENRVQCLQRCLKRTLLCFLSTDNVFALEQKREKTRREESRRLSAKYLSGSSNLALIDWRWALSPSNSSFKTPAHSCRSFSPRRKNFTWAQPQIQLWLGPYEGLMGGTSS